MRCDVTDVARCDVSDVVCDMMCDVSDVCDV